MRWKCFALCLSLLALSCSGFAQNHPGVTQIGQLNPSAVYYQAFYGAPAISPRVIGLDEGASDNQNGAAYIYELQ